MLNTYDNFTLNSIFRPKAVHKVRVKLSYVFQKMLSFIYTVKPCYIATIRKREFWRFNEFGDRSRSGFLSVTFPHSKICMRYR